MSVSVYSALFTSCIQTLPCSSLDSYAPPPLLHWFVVMHHVTQRLQARADTVRDETEIRATKEMKRGGNPSHCAYCIYPGPSPENLQWGGHFVFIGGTHFYDLRNRHSPKRFKVTILYDLSIGLHYAITSQVTHVTMVPRVGNETLRPLGVAMGNAFSVTRV